MTSSSLSPRFVGPPAHDADGNSYDAGLRSGVAQRAVPGEDTLALESFLSVLACARHLTDPLDHAAELHGISLSRFVVLLRLWKTPSHAAPMNVIATWCNVTPRNITGLVDGLESTGMVARNADPADRRVTVTKLTAAGIRLVEEYAPQHRAIIEGFMATLLPAEQHSLIDMCTRLATAASAQYAE